MENEKSTCPYCGNPEGNHANSCRSITERFKVEYTPSRKKRFEISNDEYTHERVTRVSELYHRLKDRFPELVSINLFGSIVQGKELNDDTTRVTDIDLAIYVDVSILPQTSEDEQNKFWKETSGEIRDATEQAFHEIRGLSEAEETFKRNDIFIMLIKDDSIIKWYEETFVRNGSGRDYVSMFFGMNIGDGINKYRLHFLEHLRDLGGEGEKRWEDFVLDLSKKEKKTDSEDGIINLYPVKLADAIALYETNPSFHLATYSYEEN
jgi:hypothetical protein